MGACTIIAPFVPLTSFSETIHLAHFAPATLVSQLFLEHVKHVFITDALPLPNYNFPVIHRVTVSSVIYLKTTLLVEPSGSSYLALYCLHEVSFFFPNFFCNTHHCLTYLFSLFCLPCA